MSDTVSKNLGVITAYGMAVQGGYAGTKQQFYACLDQITNGYKKIQIMDMTQPLTPLQWVVYQYTLAGSQVITFNLPSSGYVPTFELWLTQLSNPVAFTWGQTIWWDNGSGTYSVNNPQPDFNSSNKVFSLIFRYDGTRWLGNLSYVVSL